MVFKNFDSYSECIEQWTSYAGGWMESNFKGVNQTTGDGIFYIPSLVNNCSTVDIGTAGFLRLLNQQDIRYYQERLSPAQEGPQSQFDQVVRGWLVLGDAGWWTPAEASFWDRQWAEQRPVGGGDERRESSNRVAFVGGRGAAGRVPSPFMNPTHPCY